MFISYSTHLFPILIIIYILIDIFENYIKSIDNTLYSYLISISFLLIPVNIIINIFKINALSFFNPQCQGKMCELCEKNGLLNNRAMFLNNELSMLDYKLKFFRCSEGHRFSIMGIDDEDIQFNKIEFNINKIENIEKDIESIKNKLIEFEKKPNAPQSNFIHNLTNSTNSSNIIEIQPNDVIVEH